MLKLTTLLLVLAATADLAIVTVEEEVLAAQSARIKATIDADVATLEDIYAADLVYAHSDGRVDDRLVLLNAISTGAVDYKNIDIVEQNIRVVRRVAVITGTADFRVHAGGQLNELTLRFTSVYAYQAESWQFISWHSTLVP